MVSEIPQVPDQAPKKTQESNPGNNQVNSRNQGDRPNVVGAVDVAQVQKSDNQQIRPDVPSPNSSEIGDRSKKSSSKGSLEKGNNKDGQNLEKNKIDNDSAIKKINDRVAGRPDVPNRTVFKDGKFSTINDGVVPDNPSKQSYYKNGRRMEIELSQLKQDITNKPDNGTEKSKGSESVKARHGKSDTKESLSESERKERNRIADIDNVNDIDSALKNRHTSDKATGVAFKYNEFNVTEQDIDKLAANLEKIHENLDNDPSKYVLIEAYTSVTGSIDYNSELADKRAESVKNALLELGMPEERIQARGKGEVVQLVEAEESDNADHRVAIIDIRSEPPEKIEDPYKNIETLDTAIKDGKETFLDTANTQLEMIRKNHQLEPKLFLENPSADPIEFLNQVKELGKELATALKELYVDRNPKELAILITKMSLDWIIDITSGVRAPEIAKARDRQYSVLIEGMVSGLYKDYKTDTTDYSPGELLLHEFVKNDFNRLSDMKKYNVKTFFIAGKHFEIGGFTNRERFENHFNASTFKRGVDNFLNQKHYRYD